MTIQEARKILLPPLQFGNERQIEAVRFLEQVEECTQIFMKCPHPRERYGAPCPHCGTQFDPGVREEAQAEAVARGKR